MQITNNSNIPLALSVWLLNDNYDYVYDPNYISATQLLKPVKQIILSKRLDNDSLSVDIEDFIARSLGTSLHDSIEKAWTHHPEKALKALGYSDSIINRIKVNPTKEELQEDTIPVYVEQRAIKELNGYKVGGKFDITIDGILHDNKSTSAYTWLYGTKDEDYKLQGSIYRWLNPDKITEDFIRINFIFTDWNKVSALSNKDYPQKRLLYKDISLMSLQETEQWIKNKLVLIDRYKDLPEEEIPDCTDEELWRSETKYKYYANASNTSGKATKNFTDLTEAMNYWKNTKAGKGTVITVKGEPRRCAYCNASPICKQRARYFPD